MLSILGPGRRLCDGITRREILRVGGLSFTGLAWADWLRASAVSKTTEKRPKNGSLGKAKSCILLFNYGGPSHLDIWDLKPEAPIEIRGEFKPASTNVPGIRITEYLPRLAKLAHRYAIVRSVNHVDNDHAVGTYLALTGYPHPRSRPLGVEPAASPLDMPSLGSLVSKLYPLQKPVFPYVTLGHLRHFGNGDSMGQNAGCLGKIHDPFSVIKGAADIGNVKTMMASTEGTRLQDRRQLLTHIRQLSGTLDGAAPTRNLDGFSARAYDLLASPASRNAFDIEKEPQKIRDLYGPKPFAQNCLLARRLVEAGVPLVTVYSAPDRDWDTHDNNCKSLKNMLLPTMDEGLSALLSDLESRGLLDETLVVWMGDMGRTPLINKSAGRDHWSYCYSVVLAGAGVRGGQVFGSSDRSAAYPSTHPVSPADMAATIFHCLGINPDSHLTDQQGRPMAVCTGTPIEPIFG